MSMLRFRVIGLLIALLLGGTLARAAVPAIQEATLANGLRVLLIEAHNVPMVSMQLAMPAGSRFDAEGKGGSAALLAAMLTDHTARHDDQAFAEWLDERAIRLAADVDRDAMRLSLTSLVEELPTALDVLSESLLQPGWNGKRFAILKQDSIAAARKAQEEPGVRASDAVASMLFKGHPYGHRPEGDVQSLPHIELADLQAVYRAQVKPQGAVLAVSGDVTMASLKPMLEKVLGGWHGKPDEGLMDIASPKPVAGLKKTIEMPTTQTLVQLVRLGPARNDADFFPVFVMNHILGGGGFASRLMEEVREKRGLVYGVYSYFVPLAVPGTFAIFLQTRADQADQADRVVRDVMRQMAAGEITRQQLDAAKDNLTGSFAQRMDSNHERVGLMAMIGLYHLPLDYLQRWTDRVGAVTLDEVRAQAERFLDPAAWDEVRVGPSAAVGKQGGR